MEICLKEKKGWSWIGLSSFLFSSFSYARQPYDKINPLHQIFVNKITEYPHFTDEETSAPKR